MINYDEYFKKLSAFYEVSHAPGFSKPYSLLSVEPDPCSEEILAAGVSLQGLNGAADLGLWRLNQGKTEKLTKGPGISTQPKFSRSGDRLAYLSDCEEPGRLQLYVCPRIEVTRSRKVLPSDRVSERLDWCPGGNRIMLLSAEPGADQSSAEGGLSLLTSSGSAQSWQPTIRTSRARTGRRRLEIFDFDREISSSVNVGERTIWSAAWCGNDAVVALTSEDPGERGWYGAELTFVPLSGGTKLLHKPSKQIGALACNQNGDGIAFVEGWASDRNIVAGEVQLIDPVTGNVKTLPTKGVDVSFIEWRSDGRLAAAGLRKFETVLLVIDTETGAVEERAAASDWTCGLMLPEFKLNSNDEFIVQQEGYALPPRVVRIGTAGDVKLACDLSHEGSKRLLETAGEMIPLEWSAPDGTNVFGWFLKPIGQDVTRLIMDVHGGPVWAMRNMWLGRSDLSAQYLCQHGVGVFFPNPRGSMGLGVGYQSKIIGGMGEVELEDFLSGLDAVEQLSKSPAAAIGITGGSYGGYISALLPTIVQRFQAAVAMSPVTNWFTQHRLSNISHFDSLFLSGDPIATREKYALRSPIYRAAFCKTPTLLMGGAGDKCTPPEQISGHYSALREAGVAAAMAIYPEEGHGVRRFPAVIDSVARKVAWFDNYLSEKGR